MSKSVEDMTEEELREEIKKVKKDRHAAEVDRFIRGLYLKITKEKEVKGPDLIDGLFQAYLQGFKDACTQIGKFFEGERPRQDLNYIS